MSAKLRVRPPISSREVDTGLAVRSPAATWRTPAYKPDCAGCHASRFKPDPHKKYGDVKYTVSELRNCSGACHVYTSSALTTILTRRSGPEHRITDDKFN